MSNGQAKAGPRLSSADAGAGVIGLGSAADLRQTTPFRIRASSFASGSMQDVTQSSNVA
jgi:hypothetical protein